MVGLEEPYDDKVLSMLLFASEEWEEPPFKLFTDIGWLWRGYCLAYDVASSIRGAPRPGKPKPYPDWTKQAKMVLRRRSSW
jgi:hypothetical protein